MSAAVGGMSRAAARISEMAGGIDQVDIKISNFVDAVPKRHQRGETEELFICGTPSTTPALAQVSREWPHPWLYSRVFLVLLASFAALFLMLLLFGNPITIPSIMFIGALLVPFPLVIFFFETNAFRNVSFARVIEIFFIGGAFSIVAVHILNRVAPDNIFPGLAGGVVSAVMTGIVEELAKALLVGYFLSKSRGQNYILSGLLIGAAVGAGFAVFETAGYIFEYGYMQGYGVLGVSASMIDVTLTRAVLSVGGHVAWAAVEGGALAALDRGRGFDWGHLFNEGFLPFIGICMVLHAIWDLPQIIPIIDWIEIPVLGGPRYILLCGAIWVVLFLFMNRGIVQVNELSNLRVQPGGPSDPMQRDDGVDGAGSAAPAAPAAVKITPPPLR